LHCVALPNSNINFSKNSKKTHRRATKANQQTFIIATAKVFLKKTAKKRTIGQLKQANKRLLSQLQKFF
jgi:hypothetical protein